MVYITDDGVSAAIIDYKNCTVDVTTACFKREFRQTVVDDFAGIFSFEFREIFRVVQRADGNLHLVLSVCAYVYVHAKENTARESTLKTFIFFHQVSNCGPAQGHDLNETQAAAVERTCQGQVLNFDMAWDHLAITMKYFAAVQAAGAQT